MSKAIGTSLHLIVSLMLFSAMALAHAGGNNANHHKTKNKEHHSPFAKLAFWHHHKDGQRNAKHAQAKHAQTKPAPAKAAQTKAAPPTVPAGKKDDATSKAPAQKAAVTTKKKPQERAQNGATAR